MLNRTLAAEKCNGGFTLVELMITLSIAGILVTVGVPSFASMIASNRVTAASNEVVTALNLGKSEAIRSGQNTILCRSANGTACSGNWSDGWILFNDTDDDQTKDTGEQIIRVHAAPDANLQFTFRTADLLEFKPNGGVDLLAFKPDGTVMNTGLVGGRFCLRNSYSDENSRAVLITKVGRIRTEVRTGSHNDCET